MIDPATVDLVLDKLTINVRNNTVDTAAKVAALYGAPKEVVDAILRLKNIAAAVSSQMGNATDTQTPQETNAND